MSDDYDRNVCTEIYSGYPMSDYLPGVFGNVGVGGIVLGVIYFASAAITIAWIRQQQYNALRGMEGAAKHVIFPIYLPIMWVSAIADCMVGLAIFLVRLHHEEDNSWASVTAIAFTFAVQHFALEGTAFLLLQYGCGKLAVKRAALSAAAWGFVTFCIIFFTYKSFGGGWNVGLIIFAGWTFILLVFYSIVCFTPRKILFRRPAVIYYARFWVLYQAIVFTSICLEAFGRSDVVTTAGDCLYFLGAVPMFVLCKVLVLYRTLLLESKWWQGVAFLNAGNPRSRTSLNRNNSSRSSTGSTNRSKWFGALYLFSSRPKSGNADISRALLSSDNLDTESGLASAIGGQHDSGCATPTRQTYPIVTSDAAISQVVLGSNEDFASSYVESHADRLVHTISHPNTPIRNTSTETSQSMTSGYTSARHSIAPNAKLAAEGAGPTFFERLAPTYYDQIRGPLQGIEVGFSEAQELAREVDNISRNMRNGVKLLNFAYLSLAKNKSNSTQLLGSGSFSKVYAGKYRGEPVAVKMLFTQDLNPDVIKRYSTEAKILSEVGPHPNVVNIFGVAVLPPSVCLVLEICEFGSLADVLRGTIDYNPNTTSSSYYNSQSNDHSEGRPPLNLSYSDRLFLALGCARGVQALHEHSPLLCHRDIKSFNFLIDSQLNAKIADLDLGQEKQLSLPPQPINNTVDNEIDDDNFSSSRSNSTIVSNIDSVEYLSRRSSCEGSNSVSQCLSTAALTKNIAEHSLSSAFPTITDISYDASKRANIQTVSDGENGGNNEHIGNNKKVKRKTHFRRTVKAAVLGRDQEFGDGVIIGGSNMCIYWQAPEVLRGEGYTQKSDIHSLGLVLWEVLSAARSVKYVSASSPHAAGNGRHNNRSNSSGGVTAGAISYGTPPYHDYKNQQEVRKQILSGKRPTIPKSVSASNTGTSTLTCGVSRELDPLLAAVLCTSWDPLPENRPTAQHIVETLYRCWRRGLHDTIFETEFIVDEKKIEQENFRLTVLNQKGDSRKNSIASGNRWGNTDTGTSSLKSKSGNMMTSSRLEDVSTPSKNGEFETPPRLPKSTGRSGLLKYMFRFGNIDNSATFREVNDRKNIADCMTPDGSRGYRLQTSDQRHQRTFMRQPPSPEVIASLLLMRSEQRWTRLEDEGAFLIMTPSTPFYMLWATKKWTQLTGYLVNDIIAHDIWALLGGANNNTQHLTSLVTLVAQHGSAQHTMITIYRRDGKPLRLSVHIFPVYDSSPRARMNLNKELVKENHWEHIRQTLCGRDSIITADSNLDRSSMLLDQRESIGSGNRSVNIESSANQGNSKYTETSQYTESALEFNINFNSNFNNSMSGYNSSNYNTNILRSRRNSSSDTGMTGAHSSHESSPNISIQTVPAIVAAANETPVPGSISRQQQEFRKRQGNVLSLGTLDPNDTGDTPAAVPPPSPMSAVSTSTYGVFSPMPPITPNNHSSPFSTVRCLEDILHHEQQAQQLPPVYSTENGLSPHTTHSIALVSGAPAATSSLISSNLEETNTGKTLDAEYATNEPHRGSHKKKFYRDEEYQKRRREEKTRQRRREKEDQALLLQRKVAYIAVQFCAPWY